MKRNIFTKLMQARAEDIYSRYPRKLGKSPGFKTLRAQCKTPGDLDDLDRAVTNYCLHILRESTEPRYILYFSTFMHQWRDWVNPETGTIKTPGLDLSDAGFE